MWLRADIEIEDSVTVDAWFGASTAQLSQIRLSDGSVLDSSVAQLVQAMAAYSSSHTSFDATAVSQIPSGTALQAGLAISLQYRPTSRRRSAGSGGARRASV